SWRYWSSSWLPLPHVDEPRRLGERGRLRRRGVGVTAPRERCRDEPPVRGLDHRRGVIRLDIEPPRLIRFDAGIGDDGKRHPRWDAGLLLQHLPGTNL